MARLTVSEPSRSTACWPNPGPPARARSSARWARSRSSRSGIGAIIGAGLFVRTAAAIAERAGPSVTLAFIVAGVGCAFAGLCYAEFASMIPDRRQRLHLLLRDDGRARGVDHRLGPGARVRGRRGDGRDRVERVLQQGARVRSGCSIPYQWSHSPFEASTAGDARHHEHPGGLHPRAALAAARSAAPGSRRSSTTSSSSSR